MKSDHRRFVARGQKQLSVYTFIYRVHRIENVLCAVKFRIMTAVNTKKATHRQRTNVTENSSLQIG